MRTRSSTTFTTTSGAPQQALGYNPDRVALWVSPASGTTSIMRFSPFEPVFFGIVLVQGGANLEFYREYLGDDITYPVYLFGAAGFNVIFTEWYEDKHRRVGTQHGKAKGTRRRA